MSKRPLDPDYLFDIFRLNKWFAISSIALFLAVGLMVQKDYDREWKSWQRKFRKLEYQRSEAQIAEMKKALEQNPEYQAATSALSAANAEYRKNEISAFNVQQAVKLLKDRKYAQDNLYKSKKADYDALRYTLEEAREHNTKNHLRVQQQYRRLGNEVAGAKISLEQITDEISKTEKALEEYSAAKQKAQADIDALSEKMRGLEKKANKLAPSIVQLLLDIPLLDFIQPSTKVKQIVVRDIREDYNFAKVERTDNCMSCHVAIDRAGYEDQPNPLKTHPNLDLFLSAKSKHTIDDFGCTSCHSGLGAGLTFTTAAHTPQSEEQAADWKKKYGWHRMEQWANPMIALPFTEGTCYGCHNQGREVPKGEKISRALEMVEHYGCFGCHEIEGWKNIQKTGPSLRRVNSKLNRDFMYKWVRNPKGFRPRTNMPQMFDLPNTNTLDAKNRSTAEIQAAIAYLLQKSEPYTVSAVTTLPPGDVARGKDLFGKVGCLGCHIMDDFPSKRDFKAGPELSRVGSKVTREWLAAWLKNPKDYWPETRMPNLRLTNNEIADLVEYLSSKKDPEFDAQPVPSEDIYMMRTLALDHMKSRMPILEAQKKVRSMSDVEVELYVGERTISFYGCFGCHNIPGFEEAKPTGAILSVIANKPIGQIDFGFAKVDHTVESYIYNKLLQPRIYDEGKEKGPLEKLKMPWFQFTPEEAKSIFTFLTGLRKYDIAAHRKPLPTAENVAIGEGRQLIKRLNCRGCHTIEGRGGEILDYYEDPSLGPPNLNSEGKKVQQDWLYHFLQGPTPIRPWLNVRMPTFGFTDDEKNTIIRYFRALDHLLPQIENQPVVSQTKEEKDYGNLVFSKLSCLSCHVVGKPDPNRDTSTLAPNFQMAKNRLRYDWIAEWLRNPQKLMPGTRMPGLFYNDDGTPMGIAVGDSADPEKQITAVRNHIWTVQ